MARIKYVRIEGPAAAPVGVDPDHVIRRIVVEHRDDAGAAHDWESELGSGNGTAVVRVSPTRPRIADLYPALPMRFFEVGGAGELRAAMDRVTPYLINSGTATSLAAPIDGVLDALEGNRWPTCDFLHFATLAASERLLLTSRPNEPGTLGWLVRLVDRWQTRLVTIAVGDATALPLFRRFAARLVAGGGPAVMLFAPPVLPDVVDFVVHDRPLDWIAAHVSGVTLFAGMGREEAMRFSEIAEQLADPKVVQRAIKPGFRGPSLAKQATEIAGTMARELKKWTFELHEVEGLFPLNDLLGPLRAQFGTGGKAFPSAPQSTERGLTRTPRSRAVEAASRPPRFVKKARTRAPSLGYNSGSQISWSSLS